MLPVIGEGVEMSDAEAVATIDRVADGRDPAGLLVLLAEDHPIYNQRGSAVVSRLRGWVLLALERTGVTEDALPFVLEELESGLDPYAVAAAARALRAYAAPSETFSPFLLQAFTNMTGRDEPLSFEAYDDYAVGSGATSPIREILKTLACVRACGQASGCGRRGPAPEAWHRASKEARASRARAVRHSRGGGTQHRWVLHVGGRSAPAFPGGGNRTPATRSPRSCLRTRRAHG